MHEYIIVKLIRNGSHGKLAWELCFIMIHFEKNRIQNSLHYLSMISEILIGPEDEILVLMWNGL